MTETFDKEHFVELLEALHKDQSGLESALLRVRHIIDGYDWLAEGGRGSHEYDSDDYYKEIGRCFEAIKEEIDVSIRKSRDFAHQICCGKYRHVGRHPKFPTQRRIRMGQLYNDFADTVLDLALIEGEEGLINVESR